MQSEQTVSLPPHGEPPQTAAFDPAETQTKIDPKSIGVDDSESLRLTREQDNKYKFRNSIGRGGTKIVLRVHDADTARDVAMAILPDAAARPHADILRFLREARLTANLEHPNIVPIHDIGLDANGTPYFTMKLIRGETLRQALVKLEKGDPAYVKRYTRDRLLRIFLKVCQGVAFAHSKGVIHLDLKPENIQIGDFDEVVIMDWGIARLLPVKSGRPSDEDDDMRRTLKDDGDVTADGIRKGTPGFMAPEQAAGMNSALDFRTDIYSLGAILYYIITLRSPIRPGDVTIMLNDTIHGNFPPPSEAAPERNIPAALEAVILKAMSLRQSGRYDSVKSLIRELYAFIGGYATEAEGASVLRRTVLFLRRHSIFVSLFAIIVFLVIAFGFYGMRENARKSAAWIPVFERSFPKDDAAAAPFALEGRNWKADEAGLLLPSGERMSFSADLEAGMRLELLLQPDGNDADLRIELTPDAMQWGAGAAKIEFDAAAGELRAISGEEEDACATSPTDGRPFKLSVMRSGGLLSAWIDDGEPVRIICPSPVRKSPRDLVSIRNAVPESSMRLRSIALATRLLPERPTPLLPMETLLALGHDESAFSRCLQFADAYPSSEFADDALCMAYRIAAERFSGDMRRKSLLDVKRKIVQRPGFRHEEAVRELDAVLLWRQGEWENALDLLDSIAFARPKTDLAVRMIEARGVPAPQSVYDSLFRRLADVPNLRSLNLSGLNLTSLEALRGLPLTHLDLSGNRGLTTLNGLEKSPIRVLRLEGTDGLADVSALKGRKGLVVKFGGTPHPRRNEIERQLPDARFLDR